MRTIVAVVGIIVALAAVPGMVAGQGLPGFGGTGMPTGPAELYVGYASNGGMTKYTEDPILRGTVFDVEGDYDYAVTHALYLGAGLPIKLGDALTFRLAGSVTVPVTWDVEQLSAAPPHVHERTWKGDTIWGTVEGLAYYPLGSAVSAVAGFRWDHWQTSFKRPTNANLALPFGFFAPTDTADLTVNAYLPLVGTVTTMGGFTFGVVGFPWAFGDLETHESRNLLGPYRLTASSGYSQGYYVEVFTELELPTASLFNTGFDGSTSIFAKFNSFEAKGRHTVVESGIINASNEIGFAFRRNLFVIGAKGTINFSLPNLSSYF